MTNINLDKIDFIINEKRTFTCMYLLQIFYINTFKYFIPVFFLIHTNNIIKY